MAGLLFRLRGVTRTYGSGGTEVRALRGVDLDIEQGHFMVLLGPSGSGKSTFLNIIGGLDRPSSGEVLFRGADLARLPDPQLTEYRRREVGFVFQFYNLVPSLTARENVQLVTDISVDPMPASEALALVGLETRGESFPSQLSGGEQQRIAIARAVARRPAVMLCDEPTGALDSATGTMVLQALLDANTALGTTMLVVTHNAAIADLAHRVLRFRDGMVVDDQLNAVRRKPGDISW